MQNEKSVITGGIYLSRNGFRFEVVDIAKAGSDCSIDMVVYVNLDATNDFPPGQKWVLELESFVSKFKLDGCGRSVPDNSWHERGELPPVGCECEVLNNQLYNPAWEKCTILFMGKFKCIYSSESCSERVGNVDLTEAIEFRPLRTEREKAVEEMLDAARQKGRSISKDACKIIYDAGYRKVKP